MIDINEIEKQIQQAVAEKIEKELITYDLYNLLERQIVATVDEKVNATVTGLLNRLINSNSIAQQVNSQLAKDIQQKLDLEVKARVASTVSQTDVGTEISVRIADFVEHRMAKADLPNSFIPARSIDWQDFKLSADRIGRGVVESFVSSGIEDIASEINLTVMDGRVVVEQELVTQHLSVLGNTALKNLTVDRITINQDIVIQSGKFVEDIRNLIDNRIEHHKNQQIDLQGRELTSNQVKLIDTKSLGPTVVESNLRKLGRLTDLSVIGETNLAETVYVNNGRLGINTDEPAGVFTAWDEEAEITVRKYRNRNMYIGSTRDSDLTLGVAGNGVLEINRLGIATTTVKIGNVTISTASAEPVHRGAPGDLVINDRPTANQPWAWRCTGGTVWVGLI